MQKKIKIKHTRNPLEKKQQFEDATPDNFPKRLIGNYSVLLAKDCGLPTPKLAGNSSADALIVFKEYVLEKQEAFMVLHHSKEAHLESQKKSYEDVLLFIDNSERDLKNVVLSHIFNTNNKTPEAVQLAIQGFLVMQCEAFNRLNLIAQRHALAYLNSRMFAWIDIIKKSITEFSIFEDGLFSWFSPSQSCWHSEITRHLQQAQSMEDFNQKAMILMLSFMDKQPVYSMDHKLAFAEIMERKNTFSAGVASNALTLLFRPPQPSPKPRQYVKGGYSPDIMPADTEEAWSDWIYDAMKKPETLKRAFNNMVIHVQEMTKDPEVDLLRFIKLCQLAIRLIEAVKWHHGITTGDSLDALASTAKQTLSRIWKWHFATTYHTDKNPKMDVDVIQSVNAEKTFADTKIDEAIESSVRPDWIQDSLNYHAPVMKFEFNKLSKEYRDLWNLHLIAKKMLDEMIIRDKEGRTSINTSMAELRTEMAETRKLQAETRKSQAETRKSQAETRKSQAKVEKSMAEAQRMFDELASLTGFSSNNTRTNL